MKKPISKDLIAKWLHAWCLSRELPLPVTYRSGFKVDVGFEHQKSRYVFEELNEDFIQLSKEINEPWIFLKVCATPKEIENKVAARWKIQPQGYMMYCDPMNISCTELDAGYTLVFENYNSTALVKIVAENGELAAEGRLIIVDDLAVYDRIKTNGEHRRKGLATFLINELQKIALSQGVFKNFLVATEEGKLLYETLGWELYTLYSSIVLTD